MSRIQFGTLSRPAFPPKDRVTRSGAGAELCLPAEVHPFPFLCIRAAPRGIRNTKFIPSPFGVAAHAGNEAARFEDQIADGAVELRRGGRRRERERHAQAGAHVRDSETTRGARRRDHRHRRGRGAAGRLRLPALARFQLSRRPRRHLRLAVADPPLRSPHRRHRRGPDQKPEGRRALFRPAQGQHHQFRGPGEAAPQDSLRQSDAALSRRVARDGNARSDQQGQYRPGDRHRVADRQGPARTDRGASRAPARP